MKIGLAQPDLGYGGAEAAAIWGLQALREQHELTLLTLDRVDLERLNAFYGTSLAAGQFRVRQPAAGLGRLLKGHRVRRAFFQRFCSGVHKEFDLLVSTHNPLDVGVPALHLVADFSWSPQTWWELQGPLHRTALRSIHRLAGLRTAYGLLVRWLARPSGRDLFSGQDRIVANSRFTAEVLRERLGIEPAGVLYPPVCGAADPLPFARREPGFVCLGRLRPEKRIEQIIEILARVRDRGHRVHLHVVGGPLASGYARSLRRLARARGDWVVWEGERIGREKWELLARHRFGIHACQGESFGIAVAEMCKAGCVVFAPDRGGPAEILADRRLLFRTTEEAVAKIDAVLRDEALARRLSAQLLLRGGEFSAERFMEGFRRTVGEFALGRARSG
ncbi:MAG: hypothetical protein KatS3mg102_0218 [Planctomycetota bacterium]|nr:MAG: hypothetical protein KatS3mg102_0218 [Planctomycetota bacterium]